MPFKCLFSMFLISFFSLQESFAQNPRDPLFSFGLITDVQYADIDQVGKRDYRGAIVKLENTLDILNEHDLAFTVNLGDLIDQDFDSFEKPLSALKSSKAPLHHVFGNHDFTIADELKPKVGLLLGNSRGYYTFDHMGMTFIILNGMDISLEGNAKGSPSYLQAEKKMEELEAAGANNAKPWNGAIGEEQIRWFAAELKKADQKEHKTVVFCHYPLVPENGLHLWNNREILTLIRKSPSVVAYFSGHHHDGNYVMDEGVHHITFKGMVEATSDSLGAVIEVYADKMVIHGIGDQEDQVLEFR